MVILLFVVPIGLFFLFGTKAPERIKVVPIPVSRPPSIKYAPLSVWIGHYPNE